MGYYTDHELDILEGTVGPEFEDLFYKITGYRTDDLNGIGWFDREENMIEISKRYPTVIFRMFGAGSASDDRWVAYWKGGKMKQTDARIEYDGYDEALLE